MFCYYKISVATHTPVQFPRLTQNKYYNLHATNHNRANMAVWLWSQAPAITKNIDNNEDHNIPNYDEDRQNISFKYH